MLSQRSHVVYEIGGIRVRSFIDNNNARISNLGAPTSPNDAATKAYVDANITSSEIFAGTGLTKIGTTFSVNNNLSNVTGLGNINSGTWSANTINVPYGGTGRSMLTANKLLMGDGTNPVVSISQISFESSRLQSTAPVFISNTTSGPGIGSGGSFITLGGASISGKTWIGNDVNITGDVTLGSLRITGSANFSSISAAEGSYTNSTATNILNVNITSSNAIITNSRLTNITNTNTLTVNNTTTNLRTSNLTTSSLYVTNDIITINLSVTQATMPNLLSTFIRTSQFTTSSLNVTNFTGSSGVVTSLNATTVSSANLWAISTGTTYINSTTGTFTSLTTSNLNANGNSVLSTTTISNLISSSITVPNILVTNLRTTNITTNSLVNVSTISTNTNTTNLSTTNLVNTNITTSSIVSTNITTTNITTTSITSATLRITDITTLSTTNSISLSTGYLSVSGLSSLNNATATNITVSNIVNTNLSNSNISTTNINVTNVTSSNLTITNVTTLGTVGSINLSTGNIHSSSTTTLNQQTAVTATIGNLRVTNISILGTVNSNNLSTANIAASIGLTVPLINTTSVTTTNLSVTNVRGTNISSSTLNITGLSALGTVNSNNLSTGNIAVTNLSQLTHITGSTSTISNIIVTNISSSNLIATNNVTVNRSINVGSNFSSTPNASSGNILNILPSVFTDNASASGSTIPFWSTAFFANSTLSAQNNVTTRKISSVYVQGDPIVGINQTVEQSAAIAIGYVNNQTGGNMTGQIILERNDGNWYGSIFTEASTNKVVVANASLSGGGGIGFYTYTGTKVSLANIPSSTNFTPSTYLEFGSDTTNFYSTTQSTYTTTGSVVIAGGLGVAKTITCDSIKPKNILSSIKSLQDVDSLMTPTNGDTLVWNGSMWTTGTGGNIGGGSGSGGGTTSGSAGPTTVQVYPMNLVMPVMTSNGPEAGEGGNYYVSASSEFSASYAAYKCISSITLPTDWATLGENTNFWIKVQLPSSQNVRYVVLEGRINNEDPLTVTIQGSNDDITYTDIITNETFTALNYTGYFSARIPDNKKDYIYYKFLFPTAAGVNSGLNMLRLFKYDNSAYTEGILDNSSVEGNGKFNKAVINGRWPMAFDLDKSTIVNIRAQITCFTPSSFVLRKFVMYINGAPFQNDGSTFVKQYLHQNLHTSIQVLEWTGNLPQGIHTLSFFVDGGTGVNFDINDNIRVHVVKY